MNMRPENNKRISIAKDLILFVVGLGGIIFQLVTRDVNVPLLTVFTAFVGVPGLTNLLSLFKSGFGTESSSSAQVPSRSDLDSPK